MRLNLGLQNLLNSSADGDFEELLFWGRITGTRGDYYIAMGVTYKRQYEFPTKTFFFASSTDFVFKKFRDINTFHKDKYDGLTGAFTGDSALVHIKVEPETTQADIDALKAAKQDANPDPLEDTPEEDPEAFVIKRSLIEEDRLLFTVLAIENDCQIVPKDAFRMTEDHEVERNVAFRGAARENCFILDSYSHFRNVQSEEKQALLLQDDAVFQPDFLDEVSGDKPAGCWSIQQDSSMSMAVIRNNLWAGYTAYHTAGTGDFGGIYVGDGQKNLDLVFQI